MKTRLTLGISVLAIGFSLFNFAALREVRKAESALAPTISDWISWRESVASPTPHISMDQGEVSDIGFGLLMQLQGLESFGDSSLATFALVNVGNLPIVSLSFSMIGDTLPRCLAMPGSDSYHRCQAFVSFQRVRVLGLV